MLLRCSKCIGLPTAKRWLQGTLWLVVRLAEGPTAQSPVRGGRAVFGRGPRKPASSYWEYSPSCDQFVTVSGAVLWKPSLSKDVFEYFSRSLPG